MSMPDEKPQFIPASAKECIDELEKEKVQLLKLLAERNKVVALCGDELYKERVSLEKEQQRNLQLAQSNTQMLAELKISKDKRKMLNHELGCKNGLLAAKRSELKVKMHDEKLDSSQASIDNFKPININRRQLSKSRQTEEAEGSGRGEEPELVVRKSKRDRKVSSKLADYYLQK